MSDLWEQWANEEEAPEEAGGDRPLLPNGAWFLGKIATKENGKAAPTAAKQGAKETLMFKAGLIVVGGEKGKVDSSFKGSYSFFSTFVRPYEQTTGISGRLVGFMNVALSRGIAVDEKDKTVRKTARWGNTLKVLKEAAGAHDVDIDAYNGDSGMAWAGLSAIAMAETEEPLYVLCKVKHRTWGTDDNKRTDADVAAVEDATEENCEKRGIVVFDDDVELGGGF